MVSNKEKTLPSLPFFNKPSNESNSDSKFMTRFSEKFPKTAEFFKKNKKPIIVSLIIFFIIILVIIIVAAVGGFSNGDSQDTGKPGINMSGKGDGTFYSKSIILYNFNNISFILIHSILDPSVGTGSCGWQNDDSEFVAALVSYNIWI